jgi:hypothetical protein
MDIILSRVGDMKFEGAISLSAAMSRNDRLTCAP